MKTERLGELLGDAVWDEGLILRLPRELFQVVLRYILGGEIDRSIPDLVKERIFRVTDENFFRSLLRNAIQCGSLDEFLAGL